VFPCAAIAADHLSKTSSTDTDTTLLDPASARLDGKVAVVTGANGASGAPVIRQLAALGADLVHVHRGGDVDAIGALQDELAADGRTAAAVIADSSTSAGAAQALSAAIDRFGGVDVVVHLPGASAGKPLAELSDEDWRRGVTANLDSAFYVLREAVRRINDDGRIILLSTSLTGVTTPGFANYAPMKAAVEQLVRTAAKEVGARRVTVNAVAPGPIDSPFVNDVTPDAALERLRAFSPQQRLGRWQEIAPVIAFLATEQARWITAQTIRVNGGMTA